MGLALASLVVLAACSEPEQQTPTGPEFKVTPPSTACDFGAVKTLINSYLAPPDQQTAQGFEGQMETAGKWTADAVTKGFAIMDLIGKASRSYAPSAIVGSNLTKALTKCMFDASQTEYTSLADGGGLDALLFDKALSHSAGGVYYVVGAGYDTPDVPAALKGEVTGLGRLSAAGPGPATFSTTGEPPVTTFTLGSWATALAGNTLNNQGGRALVYGYPVTTSPIVYEWAAIAPSTVFSPYAIVSICDGQSAENLMLHESSVGVLAYTTANLCGLPDASGTTKTGFRSKFSTEPIASIKLEWTVPPPAKMKVNTAYTVIARATALVNSVRTGLNGACLTITGSNNNGQGTALVGTEGTTDCDSQPTNQLAAVTETGTGSNVGAGYATFSLSVTKTGGLVLTLAGKKVIDRVVTFENTVVTKSNVLPSP
jgi:hypothetical protein